MIKGELARRLLRYRGHLRDSQQAGLPRIRVTMHYLSRKKPLPPSDLDESANGSSSPGRQRTSPLLTETQFRYVQTTSLAVIAFLLLMAVLYLTRTLMLPVVVAIILNFLLSPLVHRLERWRIPPLLGASLVLAVLTSLLLLGAYQLRAPAQKWMRDAPRTIPRIKAKLRSVEEPVEQIAEASKQVEELAEGMEKDDVVRVAVEQPSFASIVFSHTTALVTSLVLSGTLLFFLLASGERFLTKCVELMPTFHDKRRIVETVRAVQWGIGNYLGTVTLINMILGVVIGVVLWLLGVPNAPLWGVMAALLNYIPFVGFFVGGTVVVLVSLLSFDTVAQAAVPAAAYLLINAVEANVITPMVLGRSMSMSPVAIILWMTLWCWMWGIAGAILAVPMLAMVKIACDEIEPLEPLSKFIAV